MVLKIGAEKGLTLLDIGMLLYKPGFDEEVDSKVEILIQKTEKICSLYTKSKIKINFKLIKKL